MKLVRWLNAYRDVRTSLYDSAQWEMKQITREVAVEPLWRGRSRMLRELDVITVGLVVDDGRTKFVRGHLTDCYSTPSAAGRLTYIPADNDRDAARQRHFVCPDKFWAAWNKKPSAWHGEVWVDSPVYCAVALAADASKAARAEAYQLASALGLPVRTVEPFFRSKIGGESK